MAKDSAGTSTGKRIIAVLNPHEYASAKAELEALATIYAKVLKERTDERTTLMGADDDSHRLIYRVLGVPDEEGELIDVYQNKGRFLYKYAGTFLEHAAKICLRRAYPEAIMPSRLPNTLGTRPRNIEIDCLVASDAIEIKWRDATTDGDHITKEHMRVNVIKDAGLTPVRVMFYRPNRDQAIRIQAALKRLYASVGGEYYSGRAAWKYIKARTRVDLEAVLNDIAKKRSEDTTKQIHVL